MERRAIVGLLPRGDVLAVLVLGLGERWEQRNDGLWLRAEELPIRLRRDQMRITPYQRKLTPAECGQARALIAGGKSFRQVAKYFGVSRSAIWRIMHDDASPTVPGGEG